MSKNSIILTIDIRDTLTPNTINSVVCKAALQ